MPKKKLKKPNPSYDMPALKINADKLILGMDPGSRNHGIALVGVRNGKVKVWANSVMTHPLDTLVDFNQAKETYLQEIADWMKYQPNAMVAERFQTRGNGGPLIELVSCMLGLIAGTYPDKPFKLTIASAWKNKLQKRFDVDLKEIYKEIAVQPHQLDAALIGIYGLEQGMKQDLDYDLYEIIAQVEASSCLELKRKRNTK
jgi:hypothetical protein